MFADFCFTDLCNALHLWWSRCTTNTLDDDDADDDAELNCNYYNLLVNVFSVGICRYVEYLSESLTGCSLQP